MSKLDGRRITLPKSMGYRPKQKFIAVRIKDGIFLQPLPKERRSAQELEKKIEEIPKEKLRNMSYREVVKKLEQ